MLCAGLGALRHRPLQTMSSVCEQGHGHAGTGLGLIVLVKESLFSSMSCMSEAFNVL